MGSWHGTCGLTNLPVMRGEEVYIFPVKERDVSKYRSHCYSTSLYSPSLLPFSAKYDDYGGGTECTGVALGVTINNIRSQLFELDVGQNKHHDIAVKKDDFDVEKFFEAIHKNRLFVKGWGHNYPVFFTMVRKDVVDRMWSEWKFDVYTGKGKGIDPNDYYDRDITFEQLSDSIPSFLEECLTSKVRKKVSFENHSDTYHVSSYFRTFSTSEFWDLCFFSEQVFDLVESENKDIAIELMELYLRGKMVNEIMELTRKIWLPVMHLGSQNQGYEVYKFLNNVVSDVIEENESNNEDENNT